MTLSNRFHHLLPQQSLSSAPPSSTDSSKLSREITSPQGTLSFLRPTHAHVHFNSQKLDWNSRDHRKGRHPLPAGQRRRISTILRLEWWNISWWVALVSLELNSYPYLSLSILFSASRADAFPLCFIFQAGVLLPPLFRALTSFGLIPVIHPWFCSLGNKRLLRIPASFRSHGRNE